MLFIDLIIMEVKPEKIIVNSCEFTPVYLIPSPSVTQAGSYVLAPTNQETAKPVTDNLKRFYESSGNLANGIVSSPKPRILKKQTPGTIGNNLKLASFLIPKSEPNVVVKNELIPTVQTVPVTSNIILKPVTTTINAVNANVVKTVQTVPRVEVERKIVRVGSIPLRGRAQQARVLPKIMPKESPPMVTNEIPSNTTAVQLLKLGETYHSLNQLSEKQMKIVNQALKIFNSEKKSNKDPTYDPVTNTKYIYKVVSPRDLTVVSKNNGTTIEMKRKKTEIKKAIIKRIEKKDILETIEETVPTEPKVTRSGRTVKLPKQICPIPPQGSPKPRKKAGNVVTCFQCSAEFCSLYRLQRHYETYPTHIPAKIHSNLLHCLLAIIKSGSEEDQASIFIQQLEQLIDKLKVLLPCLIKQMNGREGRQCNINEDIGRIFDIKPGKYSLNIDALNCVKDKDGYCIHNPAPKNPPVKPEINPLQIPEEIAINEIITEDCARTNSVDKWPTVSKRIWKIKHKTSDKSPPNVKRMRIVSENNEQNIELGSENEFPRIEDDIAVNEEDNNLDINGHFLEIHDNIIMTTDQTENAVTSMEDQSKKPKGTHIQFHSTHFDIRSSPIKQSALVKKFQIDPNNLPNLEVQIMRPLTSDNRNETASDILMQSDSDNLQLFRDSELTKHSVMNADLNFDNSKDWNLSVANSDESSNPYHIKSNILFDPSLTPLKDDNVIKPLLIHVKDKLDDIFDTSASAVKTNGLVEAKATILNKQSFIQLNETADILFESSTKSSNDPVLPSELSNESLIDMKNKSNILFGASKSDNLLQSFINIKADSFFEHSLLDLDSKSNGLFEESPIQVKAQQTSHRQPNCLFEALAHVKERSHTLFEPATHKDKDSLIGPSLINVKNGASSFFEVMKDKSCLMDQSLIQIDKTTENLDISQSDLNNSNQGHSVLNLNFLETLGNELAYPETEIRNNSVDFQLDLFTFNSS